MLTRLKQLTSKVRFPIRNLQCHNRWHCVTHGGHTLAHGAYLGTVGIEAHGMYGKFALVLLAFVVIGAVMGETSE